MSISNYIDMLRTIMKNNNIVEMDVTICLDSYGSVIEKSVFNENQFIVPIKVQFKLSLL